MTFFPTQVVSQVDELYGQHWHVDLKEALVDFELHVYNFYWQSRQQIQRAISMVGSAIVYCIRTSFRVSFFPLQE